MWLDCACAVAVLGLAAGWVQVGAPAVARWAVRRWNRRLS